MSIPKEITDFMQKHGVLSDEIWLLPGGRSYAVKHKALERIAGKQGMVIESLKVLAIDLVNKTAAMEAIVKLGDQWVITTGEAAPSNNKNQYPLAMAEKRALDRAYLKLLGQHGDIYSDSEIDDSDVGERSPPQEDAIEKVFHHTLKLYIDNKESADWYVSKSKGMLSQLRVATKERTWELIKTLGKETA